MLKITDDAYIRMVNEKAQLEKKVENLEALIKAATLGDYDNITKEELDLLKEQLYYMNGYLRVLKFRIQRFLKLMKLSNRRGYDK